MNRLQEFEKMIKEVIRPSFNLPEIKDGFL